MNFKDFKFLAYENIDREVIQFLRDQGHEVISVIENQWFARSDLVLLEFAYKESLVVLTQDSDFGTLVFRDQIPFYGIIYLRPGHQSPDVHIESLLAIQNTALVFTIPFLLIAEHRGDIIKLRLRTL
jgi:predicted nuclease of predicted toxin-antitoxin system